MNELVFGNKLSEGGYGTTYNCIYKKKEAIVKIPKYGSYANMFNEIDILEKINNENIIKVLGFSKSFPNIYIIMEHGGEELFRLINDNEVSSLEKKYIIEQLINGVNYLHSNHIVHRDLKLENMVYDFKTLKIIDFGLAYLYISNEPSKNLRVRCGCIQYMAPELCDNENVYDGYLADVWSLGICAFTILSCRFPFSSAVITDYNYETFRVQGLKKFIENFSGEFDIEEKMVLLLEFIMKETNERPSILSVRDYFIKHVSNTSKSL